MILSVARHAADPAVALVDDVDTLSEAGAVTMEPDEDVAVDACVAKAMKVRLFAVGAAVAAMWTSGSSRTPPPLPPPHSIVCDYGVLGSTAQSATLTLPAS